MRLKTVCISGFRGFADEQTFDLDADVVLIHGPNGSGKTSLLDAVLWALTGSIARLGNDRNLVSRFAPLDEARVELVVVGSDDQVPLRVVRRYDGTQSLLVEQGEMQVTGSTADALLIDLLWPEAKSAPDPNASLSRSFTRAVYLQQDQVRSFLDAEDEQSRFEIVSEIVGAGRVGEMVRQLESGRRAWTTRTNRLRDDLKPVAARRNALRDQVAQLDGEGDGLEFLQERWTEWVASTTTLLGLGLAPDGDRTVLLDRLLVELRTAERRAEDQRSLLEQTSELLDRRPVRDSQVDHEALRERASLAAERVAVAQTQVSAAQQEVTEIRRAQLAESEEHESLSTLAQLALRHLGDRCPVCTQEFDEVVTRAHLESLISSESPQAGDRTALSEASELLAQAEQEQVEAQALVSVSERFNRELVRWRADVERARDELGFKVDVDEVGSQIDLSIPKVNERIDRIRVARRDGDSMLIDIARSSEVQRLSEYRAQLADLEREVADLASQILRREGTGNEAQDLHEAMRIVSESLVKGELERIEPLLQRIYAGVDPHPAFRAVRFLTDTVRGRGQMWTSIEDPTRPDDRVDEPAMVLSSSQMNVLAVVVFLALNLSVPTLPLQTIALDDPLQSLDNVNLLGLADLLRRLRNDRQVIVSTHDDRLSGLLERKLRPTRSGQRTVVIRIDGWTRSGPTVETRDVEQDPGELRLATA